MANAENEIRDATKSGLYSLYINNLNLDETKRKVVNFLDGNHVESDSVDLDAFVSELHEVLNELA